MQFQERSDVVALGLVEAIGIAADSTQGVTEFLARRRGEIEHDVVKRANHAAAAHARKAVFARFFS